MTECSAIKKDGIKCMYKTKCGNFCGIHNTDRSKNKKFGQTMVDRAGSSRNGMAVSVANSINISITDEQILYRNNLLGINDNECFYCKNIFTKDRPSVKDHLIPTCSTKTNVFGQSNILCIVPSHSDCNGSKSGKTDIKFKIWLENTHNWTDERINTLFKWIEDNKEFLYLDKQLVDYLEISNKIINKFHETCHDCAKTQKNIILPISNEIVNSMTFDQINELEKHIILRREILFNEETTKLLQESQE